MLLFRMVVGNAKSEFSVELRNETYYGKLNGKVIAKNKNYDKVREQVLKQARNVDVSESKH